MEHKRLLMVFVKNALLGKVKTKLAKSVGETKALEIYLTLLNHTHSITNKAHWDKAVFYSKFVEYNDLWKQAGFFQFVQEGKGQGECMKNAFKMAFNIDYEQVMIIGCDCLSLTEEILIKGFNALNTHDVTIGPSVNGGYYLLGMNKFYPDFFDNKVWSEENVLTDTLLDAKNLNLSYHLLDTLTGIDEEKDLKLLK